MKYRVVLSDRAKKQMKKLDKYTSRLLTVWMAKNLQGCENPRLHGKALTANRAGQWRYRVGDYRIIAEIHEYEVVILVLEVGHRKEIYD